MPKAKTSQRGIALFLVVGLSTLLFIGLLGLFFLLTANVRNLEAFKERAEAYYLCETGLSFALIQNAPAGTKRTFEYTMIAKDPDNQNTTLAQKIYHITYYVGPCWMSDGTEVPSNQIAASVGPPDFKRTYTLFTGVERAFPFFTRGFPGK